MRKRMKTGSGADRGARDLFLYTIVRGQGATTGLSLGEVPGASSWPSNIARSTDASLCTSMCARCWQELPRAHREALLAATEPARRGKEYRRVLSRAIEALS